MFRPPLLLVFLAACSSPDAPTHPAAGDTGVASLVWVESSPSSSASSAFWNHWGDGQAELSSYRATIMRYGEPREAEMVLIFVTEPMNRRTWIKDDDASESSRTNVLKLNTSIKFQTGVYPYSIMSSVFAPVDDWGMERFTPAKIAFSAQEWCGIYTHLLWPDRDRFTSLRLSYFASEGEATRTVETEGPLLYEDALPIQLRELDGPFAAGQNWEGAVVPSTIHQRFVHTDAQPLPARITRSELTDATRFELTYEGGFTRTFEIEKEHPRRLIRWYTSEGDSASLLASVRMPYWRMNKASDVRHLRELGLAPDDTTAHREEAER